MLLLIDNYDSFTWNLVQRIGELDPTLRLEVVRNDAISVGQAMALRPTHLLISPGPCTPLETGICGELIDHFAGQIPILGVCLGHQLIAHCRGMQWGRHSKLMHGKTSQVHHDGKGLFVAVPSPFTATRYHSLIVYRDGIPDDFEVSAWTDEDEIMGLRWKAPEGSAPLDGVQFHPESFLTTEGPALLANFLDLPSATRQVPASS